jgi:hypothetical protein
LPLSCDNHDRSKKDQKIPVIILLLLIIGAGVAAGCLGSQLFSRRDVLYPRITPKFSAPAVHSPVYSIPFGHGTVTLSIPLNNSVYAGAKSAEKDVIIHGNVSEEIWTAESYMAMVDDPEQEEFYTVLRAQFRKIRDAGSLDDNEYLELITASVQTLRYETVAENPPKFPH